MLRHGVIVSMVNFRSFISIVTCASDGEDCDGDDDRDVAEVTAEHVQPDLEHGRAQQRQHRHHVA
jgi:hypothetical protein